MKEKVVLITGGAGGIGIATAQLFLKRGANVALVDVNEESLQQTKDNLGGQEDRILTIQADVTDESDVKNYVEKTVEHFGKIDVFFNNAGISGPFADIVDLEKEVFEQILSINTTGVFLGLKHVLKQMKEQGYGSVVNTASNAAYIGSPGMVGYIASKHAVAGITKTAALEVAGDGIRVNAVSPAAIDTQMLDEIRNNITTGEPEVSGEAIKQGIPAGRFGSPHEVAKVVYFLASDDASFVNGSLYNVDGGMEAD